jgi:hypothetical protein
VLYVHICASLATLSLNCEDNQMRITRHRYRVKPEYVAQNRQNLDEFIAALTAASVPGLSYRVFLEEDGQTFLHLVISQDDPSALITGLPSFKKFQSELLASDPVVKPDQIGMSLVATSGDSYG